MSFLCKCGSSSFNILQMENTKQLVFLCNKCMKSYATYESIPKIRGLIK